MQAKNLNSKKILKITPAGEIPVDWTCARLEDISEIKVSKENSHQEKNCVFTDKNGVIYAERPDNIRSLRIQAKKPFSIEWISAYLAARTGKHKFTKNFLKNLCIPLPPPPEIKNARETVNSLEKLIRRRKKGRLQLNKTATEYRYENKSAAHKIPAPGRKDKEGEDIKSMLKLRESLAAVLAKTNKPHSKP